MTKLLPFLARFGLFAPKTEISDAFDLRLTRIGTREARARSQCRTFRNQSSQPADAVLS